MLSNEKIIEIREHLERAQNPIFFFDNDIDGLISFILLRRFLGVGKGIAIKSFPELDESYIRKIDEFNADYVFILDKPLISRKFAEEIIKKNIPIVWIDHHNIKNEIKNISEIIKNKLINYYNPIFSNNPTNEPTSFISYEITKRREDMWLAMAGCIGDNFLPNFSDEFSKKYPEIWKKDAKSAFEILYESELGKLILILDFALKDKTSNVVAMMNFLFNVKFPNDILIENEHNLKIISRYKSVNKVYQKLIERAKKVARTHKKIVFFHYGGDISLSANLANELSFRFPGKTILIAYIKGEIANISIRGGGDIRKTTLKAIKRIPTASGGGHKNATGAKMRASSLKDFVKIFEDEFEK